MELKTTSGGGDFGEVLECIFICEHLKTGDVITLRKNLEACKSLSFRDRSFLIYRNDPTFPYKTLGSSEVQLFLSRDAGLKDQLYIFNLWLNMFSRSAKLSVTCDLHHKTVHVDIAENVVFSRETSENQKNLMAFFELAIGLLKGLEISLYYCGEEVFIDDVMAEPLKTGFKKFQGKLLSSSEQKLIVDQFFR